MSIPDKQSASDGLSDEAKKATIPISLPQGGAQKPLMPTPTVRLRPAAVPGSIDESKKATAAITPLPSDRKEVPAQPESKPKKDTSHVATVPAKPASHEMPRPTVKLKREEPPTPTSAPAATVAAASPSPVAEDAAPTNWIDTGLALAAMVVALAVASYLFLNRN